MSKALTLGCSCHCRVLTCPTQWSVASTIWLSSLLWGQIYTAALQNFNNTAVRLFGVKQAAPTRREQVRPGAIATLWPMIDPTAILAGHSKRLEQVVIVCQRLSRANDGDSKRPALHVRHVIVIHIGYVLRSFC